MLEVEGLDMVEVEKFSWDNLCRVIDDGKESRVEFLVFSQVSLLMFRFCSSGATFAVGLASLSQELLAELANPG